MTCGGRRRQPGGVTAGSARSAYFGWQAEEMRMLGHVGSVLLTALNKTASPTRPTRCTAQEDFRWAVSGSRIGSADPIMAHGHLLVCSGLATTRRVARALPGE